MAPAFINAMSKGELIELRNKNLEVMLAFGCLSFKRDGLAFKEMSLDYQLYDLHMAIIKKDKSITIERLELDAFDYAFLLKTSGVYK